MSSREPDLRRNSLSALLPGPPVNALPAILQDATRVAPRANFTNVQSGSSSSAPAATAERHTMRAQPDLGWFSNMTRSAAQWMEKNKVASAKDYPPFRLLHAVLGDNPGEVISGPGAAAGSFLRRAADATGRSADEIKALAKSSDYAKWVRETYGKEMLGSNTPETRAAAKRMLDAMEDARLRSFHDPATGKLTAKGAAPMPPHQAPVYPTIKP